MLKPKIAWKTRSFIQRLGLCLAAFLLLATGSMYGIAQWYIHSEQSKPYVVGTSFIPDYATYLGVDPQQTMDAILSLGVKHLRLVSYWSDYEPTPGNYNFTQLDWQFKKAEAAHAKVSLSVGLRQPRYPECHAPSWVDTTKPSSQWQPQLEAFITQIVNRYKTSPALDTYQIENEFFLHGFGICTNFERSRLESEYALVQRLDPQHPLIVNRSNNGIGIPLGAPKPDSYGISIYKRVWDAALSHRYLEYPFPAWYYGFLAGTQKLHDGRDMVIHEMQAEAWAPNGKEVPDISLAEQNKSFNAERFKDRFTYARATGMRTVDMWGAEYWYYRLIILHDPSVWNVAQQEFKAR
ncbi:MAG: beta-galactosidase [Patescibacteria group bacterium]|nr:beta-galactosidase [Patescibacteria group bacterium]